MLAVRRSWPLNRALARATRSADRANYGHMAVRHVSCRQGLGYGSNLQPDAFNETSP